MDNKLKAKILIELLDDTKYPVLSSFNQNELSAIESVQLDQVNELSDADINAAVDEFIKKVETEKAAKVEEAKIVEEIEPPKPEKKKKKKSKKNDHLDSIVDKLESQPLQIIACSIERLDSTQKEYVLTNLSEEKKDALNTIDIENLPVSDQVMDVIINKLELNPSEESAI